MTDDANLDHLRAEIDRLDDAMHDLLMQRGDIVRRLAGAKGAAPSMRPAREMEVLRRLAARHRGAMPLGAVIRIWREVMAASLALQMPYSVRFFEEDNARGMRELARFHFGSATALHGLATSNHVVQEVGEGKGTVGILPEPLFEEDTPWWPHLLFAGADGPRVIARLPMFKNAPGYDFPKALAIANLEQRPTGDDVTLIALLATPELRRAKATSLLEAQGIKAQLVALAQEEGETAQRYMLLETAEFVKEDDPRLQATLNANDGLLQLRVVGGYARAIDCAGVPK